MSSKAPSQTDEEAHCSWLEQRFRLDGKQFEQFLPALTHVHRMHLPLSSINSRKETARIEDTPSPGDHVYIYLYHGAWADQRVLPWYNYNTPQWLVVIPWWLKV